MSTDNVDIVNEEPFGFFSPNKNLASSKTWVSPQGSKIDTYFETSQGSKYLRTEKGETKRWKKEMTYIEIKNILLQQEFMFGTGSGCQAGFCTD